jgi:dihydroneopterin aldolase/2-amino-4-hydroxy-6-hydroxymethyldihydropteridine diphosphokinase
MTFRVALESYTVMAKHGYFTHEHEKEQPFVFSVWTTLLEQPIEENLENTLNYADIQIAIDEVMLKADKPILLLETMAQRVTEMLKEKSNVASIHVRIEKPEAPLPHPGGLAVVELEWSRN